MTQFNLICMECGDVCRWDYVCESCEIRANIDQMVACKSCGVVVRKEYIELDGLCWPCAFPEQAAKKRTAEENAFTQEILRHALHDVMSKKDLPATGYLSDILRQSFIRGD